MKNLLVQIWLILFLVFSSVIYSQDNVEFLRKKLIQAESDTATIRIRLELASELMQEDRQASFIHIQAAISEAIAYNDSKYLGDAYMALGHFNGESFEFKKAVENFQIAASFYEKARQPYLQTEALTQLARLYTNLGAQDEALPILTEVLAFHSKQNDSLSIGESYTNLGNLYRSLDKNSLAKEYYLKALGYLGKDQNEGLRAQNYDFIGMIEMDLGDPLLAKNYFFKSLDVKKTIGDLSGVPFSYTNLGVAYTLLGKYDSADFYLKRALIIREDLGDEYGILHTNTCFVKYYNARGKYEEAVELGKRCYSTATEKESLHGQREALKQLCISYEALGDFEQALIFQKKLSNIQDTLRRRGEAFQLEEVNAAFDVNLKIRQIEELESELKSARKGVFYEDWFILTIFLSLFMIAIFYLVFRQSKDRVRNMGVYSRSGWTSERMLFVLSAFLYVLLPWILNSEGELYDPFVARLCIGGGLLISYFLSYSGSWLGRNVGILMKVFFLVMISHHFILLYANDISLIHTFYFVILLGGLNAVFKTVRSVFFFSSFIMALCLILVLTIDEPEISRELFVGLIFSVLIVKATVTYSHSSTNEELELSKELVAQADALVFVVDNKGNNMFTSHSIRSVLGVDPRKLAGHDWLEKLGLEKREAHRVKNNLIRIAKGIIPPASNSFQRFVTADGEEKWISIRESLLNRERVLVIGLDVTEQKRILDELEESENNFRQINEAVRDVFYLYSTEEERYIYISPNVTEVLGPPQAFFYQEKASYKSFVLEEDFIKFQRQYRQVLEGEGGEIEYRIRVGNTIRWIKEKIFPVRNEEGEVVKITGSCEDITELKFSREEIEKLSLVASNTDNFILLVNGENSIEWANESFFKLTGYTEEEALGKLPMQLITGPTTEESKIDAITEAIFIHHEPYKCEIQCHKKEGEIYYAQIEVNPLMDEDGVLLKYFIIGSDITEKVATRQDMETLSLVASTTSNYIIIAHRTNGVEWVNKSFEEKFGYKLEEIKGKLPSKFLHGEKGIDPVLGEEINNTLFVKKERYSGELVHFTRAGNEIYSEVDITYMKDDSGSDEKYFVLGVDISERKKYREEIEKANAELTKKEHEIQESEHNFREIIRSTNEVFWLQDLEEKSMLFISDTYASFFGGTKEDLEADAYAWTKYIHIEDQSRVKKVLELNNGKDHSFNEDFRLTGTQERWVNMRTFPVKNEAGEVTKVTVYTEDITDKKEKDLQIQNIADRLNILHSIEKTLLSSESTEAIIYNTLNKSLEKMPAVRVSLAIFDYEQKNFKAYVKGVEGVNVDLDKRVMKLKEFSMLELLDEKRDNIMINLDEREDKTTTQEKLVKNNINRILFSPLLYDDQLMGSLNICFERTEKVDINDYLEVTKEISNTLAVALQQSILKDSLKEKNNDIQSSIDYAQKIQQSYIPDSNSLQFLFSDSFVINHPRDGVSGDFYWSSTVGDVRLLAVGDCTGHGVPGAFMTIIGMSELNNIVNFQKITSPDEILRRLNEGIIRALRSHSSEVQLKDGMDLCIIAYYPKENKIIFSGAKRPLYRIQKGELTVFDGTRMSIGDRALGEEEHFEEVHIDVQAEDRFFLFSDGVTDHFGGPRTKKFGSRNLKEHLLGFSKFRITQQGEMLENVLMKWGTDHFQVDDIICVGVEI